MVEEKKEKATPEVKKATGQSEGVPQSGKEKKAEAQPKEAARKMEEKKGEEAQPKADVKKEEPKKPDIQLSKKMQDILSSIEGMTVLELSNLVKALEDKFGVTAAQPVMAVAAGAAAPGAAPEEEKSSFTVVLASIGSNKIQVIKEIRAITTLGLKEAKDLVEAAPKSVKEGATKEEAEEIKKKLEATGAKVELK